MTGWQVITAARRATFCPIAVQLRDEFTGGGALGRVNLTLDRQDGATWHETDIQPTRNPGGIHVYPGLGRSVDPAALPQFRMRLRIVAALYRPLYAATDDGILFDVPTYNDAVPPAVAPLVPETVLMLPGPAYPFARHIRVLRGRILSAGGDPVADAVIDADGVERAMSGPNGGFSLPLRWQAAGAVVNVQVDHPRTGTSATVNFTLPGDLGNNQDITVT
jgi:hypothetical protein